MAQRRTGGRVYCEAQAAVNFGGGKTIRRGRLGREEFAPERFDVCGPVWRMIVARSTGRPGILMVGCNGAARVSVEFVAARTAQAERFGGGDCRDFTATKSGHEFADQRIPETVGELAIMFSSRREWQNPATWTSAARWPCGPCRVGTVVCTTAPLSEPDWRVTHPALWTLSRKQTAQAAAPRPVGLGWGGGADTIRWSTKPDVP